MYLEIGNDLLIESRAVLGVFDLDNTSWSKRTRAFLEAAQENGELIDAAEELPKSFVLTQEFGAVCLPFQLRRPCVGASLQNSERAALPIHHQSKPLFHL